MSKFVVDSSVGLKAAIPEQDSDKAIAIQEGGHELLAPDIYPLEASHVITKLFRRREITAIEASNIFTDILDARPAVRNSMGLLQRAFEISLAERCSLWDALYVALAERENCEFVTADEKLVRNLQGKYSIVALSEL